MNQHENAELLMVMLDLIQRPDEIGWVTKEAIIEKAEKAIEEAGYRRDGITGTEWIRK
jgi:hypothetical protein